MELNELDQTQPTVTSQEPKKKGAGCLGRFGKLLLFILAGLIVVGIAGWFGYHAAIRSRLAAEETQKVTIATDQYELALKDINDGRLEQARDRLEYIIGIAPGFPGAAEKLTEVMVQISIQRTPTPAFTPTPEMTPTPDTRGQDEIYNQIVAYIQNKQWLDAYNSLVVLRNNDPAYRAVEVDGMFYIVLRNRGIEKITLEGDLMGGSYDISQAESYAPVDRLALDYREWAENYIYAASFYGVNWERAVENLRLIYESFPNLRDSTMSAQERYRISLVKYGDQLADKGKWCDANNYYQLALTIASDGTLQATATNASIKCQGPSKTPTPEITLTETLTETLPPTEVTTEPPPTTETPPP